MSLNIFDIIFSSKYSFHVKYAYLRTFDEWQSFNADNQALDKVIGRIKSLSSSAKTRQEGLVLLDAFIDQCNADIFSENAISFCQLSLNAVPGTGNAATKILSFQILGKLIKHLSSFPELSRQASINILPNVIDALIQKTTNELELKARLNCLIQCMTYFPAPCGQRRRRIEKYLLSTLDSWDGFTQYTVEKVAHCIALLPGCGGGGTQGTSYKEVWLTQFEMVLSTLESLLSKLYEYLDINNTEISSNESTTPQLPFLPITDDDPLNIVCALAKRFQSTAICLQAMFSVQFDAPTTIPTEKVIDLVLKACSVNIQTITIDKTRHSPEFTAALSVTPGVQCMALDILNTLIKRCKNNISPTRINQLLSHILSSTAPQHRKRGFNRPCRMLRSAAYGIATLCLKVLGPSRFKISSSLISHLNADIMPDEAVTMLRIGKGKQSNQNKGSGKKRGHGSSVPTNEVHEKTNEHANSSLCKEALKALKQIFQCVNYQLLPPDAYSQTFATITEVLSQVHDCESYPIPYSNYVCRLLLYEVLEGMVLNPCDASDISWSKALNLFTKGKGDYNFEVSSFCYSSIMRCTTIIKSRHALYHTAVQAAATSSSLMTSTISESMKMMQVSNANNIDGGELPSQVDEEDEDDDVVLEEISQVQNAAVPNVQDEKEPTESGDSPVFLEEPTSSHALDERTRNPSYSSASAVEAEDSSVKPSVHDSVTSINSIATVVTSPHVELMKDGVCENSDNQSTLQNDVNDNEMDSWQQEDEEQVVTSNGPSDMHLVDKNTTPNEEVEETDYQMASENHERNSSSKRLRENDSPEEKAKKLKEDSITPDVEAMLAEFKDVSPEEEEENSVV